MRPTAVEGSSAGDPVTNPSVTLPGGKAGQRRLPPEVGPGLVLADRYVLRAPLGRGGNGAVFGAWDRLLGCSIALKVFDLGLTAAQDGPPRLAREVRLARIVRHRNVCPVFDLVEAGGIWFMTMELAARTLRDELADAHELGGAPRWDARALDARAVCDGLAAIHRHGITHGDLTPPNVLRMNDGHLALADFGMARRAGEGSRTPGGTLSYLAPEVALGLAPDPRSDLWQLGIVMHEILMGARPVWRMTNIGLVAVPPASFEPPPRVVALLRVARECLAWNPALRPANADALLLHRFKDARTSAAKRPDGKRAT